MSVLDRWAYSALPHGGVVADRLRIGHAMCRELMQRVLKAVGRVALFAALAGATFLVYRLLTMVPHVPAA